MSLPGIAQKNIMADIVERCENIRTVVMMKEMVIYGKLYYSGKRRFLDTLNKGLGMKNSPDKQYLLMDEVLLVDDRGEQDRIQGTCLIPRESVVCIGAVDQTRSSVSESVDSIKFYPWRKKEPHAVKIVLGNDLSITGMVYLDPNDKSYLALESDECFIPVTDVDVRSSRFVQDLRFNFMALNIRLMVLLSFQI